MRVFNAKEAAALIAALAIPFQGAFIKQAEPFRVAQLPAYCHQWYATPDAERWTPRQLTGIQRIVFANYDYIVINTSAGKDSQTILHRVYQEATAAGFPADHIIVVHCDLGRVEWPGTAELAEAQAACFPGVRFVKMHKNGPDLLDAIEARELWPSADCRYCTSDFKRAVVDRLFTELVGEILGKGGTKEFGRRVRILNVLGFRAQESPARAARPVLDLGDELRSKKRRVKNPDGTWKTELNAKGKPVFVTETYQSEGRATNGKRIVDDWLAIHDWRDEDVWEDIRRSGVPFHRAYALGMRRLSCVFCVFAPEEALLLAGRYNPELLDAYLRVGIKLNQLSLAKTGKPHLFRQDLDILSIKTKLDSGYEPDPAKIRTWKM